MNKYSKLYYFILLFSILLLVILPPTPSILFLLLIIITFTCLAYIFSRTLLTILSIALIGRILAVLLDHNFNLLPVPPISSDHHSRASLVADSWMNGSIIIQDAELMRIVVANILAPFYILLGNSMIAGRVGIAFISLFIGYFAYRIALHVSTQKRAMIVAGLSLFWPSIFYRSIVLQREVISAAIILIFLWVILEWVNDRYLPGIPIALGCLVLMYAIRPANLLLLVVAAGTVLLIRGRRNPELMLIGIGILIPFAGYFALNLGQFTGYAGVVSPELLNAYAHGRAHGDAAYLVDLHYETWLDVILYAPIKVIYLLFTPFPWYVRGPTELIAAFSGWALFVAVLLIRRGVIVSKDYEISLVILAFLTVGVLTYAIIEMNYGAAFRRRIQFVPLILVFTVAGLPKIRIQYKSSNLIATEPERTEPPSD